MKNKLIVILLLFFIVGCKNTDVPSKSISYNLYVSDYFEENIGIALPKNAYDIAKKYSEEDGEYVSIEYLLLKKNTYPITNSDKKIYKKKIRKFDDQVNVQLSYNYLEKEFINEAYIYKCFENYDLVRAKDYFEIYLSGKFYCKTGFNEVNISIGTNFDILDSNGKKKDNNYTWIIDNNNYNDTNIYYKVARDYDSMPTKVKNNTKSSLGSLLIRVLIVIIVFGAFMIFVKIYKDNQSY